MTLGNVRARQGDYMRTSEVGESLLLCIQITVNIGGRESWYVVKNRIRVRGETIG